MLQEMNVDQVRFVALLARTAREQREGDLQAGALREAIASLSEPAC